MRGPKKGLIHPIRGLDFDGQPKDSFLQRNDLLSCILGRSISPQHRQGNKGSSQRPVEGPAMRGRWRCHRKIVSRSQGGLGLPLPSLEACPRTSEHWPPVTMRYHPAGRILTPLPRSQSPRAWLLWGGSLGYENLGAQRPPDFEAGVISVEP